MASTNLDSALPTAVNTPKLGPTKEKVDDAETVTEIGTRPASTIGDASNEKTDVEASAATGIDESKLLTGTKLLLVFCGMLLSIFLVALDQTIVATALPRIASDFNALDQLTWIVSAYFLTQAGLMLTYGQILTLAATKWIYLFAIFNFELGSLICAVAPNINVLIFGRAWQGLGASGLFISILTVIAQVTRLEQRPLLFGSFGGVFAVSSVVGPLLGGVFTDEVTWRWCFYINLPIGAISIIAVSFWLPLHQPEDTGLYTGMTTLQKWLSLDWLGSIFSLGMIVPLLLGLQWGGQSRPWSDPAVIACLCVFAAMLFVFVGWEWYKGDRAMMPLKMFKRRTQVGASGAAFMLMLIFIAFTYYLPFFYQAKGRTPTQSGLDILAYMLAAVIGTFVAGGATQATGYYWPWMFFGPMLAAVGSGLLYTIDFYTPNSKLIGYQILAGFGAGVAFQQGVLAIQAEYADQPALIPQATSLVSFLQLVGGTVGISIAGTVFGNQLNGLLTSPDSVASTILTPEMREAVKLSVLAIFELPEGEIRQAVIDAYIRALDYTFIVAVPAAVLASLFTLLVKNWNLKQRGVSGAAMAA